ncbi:hypothetical protein [Pararhizobium gei]|uniref:hypothetical protein n=1 Tax=Pararhizobium gei TaxID=1395951 RepID=UPI0023DCB74C|nr:hypothetical protein [Rhizobium gei]
MLDVCAALRDFCCQNARFVQKVAQNSLTFIALFAFSREIIFYSFLFYRDEIVSVFVLQADNGPCPEGNTPLHNAGNLAPGFLDAMAGRYGGTRLGVARRHLLDRSASASGRQNCPR